MKKSEVVFTLIVLLMAGGAVFADRTLSRRDAEERSRRGAFVSTAWYCPSPGAGALVTTTNLATKTARFRRSGVGSQSVGGTAEGTIDGGRTSSVKLEQFGVKNPLGLVETFGSSTLTDIATHETGRGTAASLCTAQPSVQWFFATASTLRGQDHSLLVANAFEEEAIIRVRILGKDKDSAPARLSDIVVAPLSQSSIALSDFVVETNHFGVVVEATQGRIAVSRFSKLATRAGVKGLSLVLGARRPSDRWYLAAGEAPTDGEEFISIANPSDKEALVQFTFQLEGEQIAPPSLAEFRLEAGTAAQLRVSDHILRGSKWGASIVSVNSVPIVVERERIAATPGGRGYESTLAAPALSNTWALPVSASSSGNPIAAVSNPTGTGARFSLSLLRETLRLSPPEMSALVLEGGRRTTIDLTPFLEGGSATVLLEGTGAEIVLEGAATYPPPLSDYVITSAYPLN